MMGDMPQMNSRPLQSRLFGLQVMIVEDEPLVSMMLEDVLTDFGCVVAGVAATVSDALSQAAATPAIDAAILDVHLGGETVYPVADLLDARGVPFVFSTGYGPADLRQRYPQSQLLDKPYTPEALANVLAGFLDEAA